LLEAFGNGAECGEKRGKQAINGEIQALQQENAYRCPCLGAFTRCKSMCGTGDETFKKPDTVQDHIKAQAFASKKSITKGLQNATKVKKADTGKARHDLDLAL